MWIGGSSFPEFGNEERNLVYNRVKGLQDLSYIKKNMCS